jgi:hypothetical protein
MFSFWQSKRSTQQSNNENPTKRRPVDTPPNYFVSISIADGPTELKKF